MKTKKTLSAFKMFRKGIFFRTFTLLITLALVIIVLFVFMIIPREKVSLLKSIESLAKSLAASISEVSANSFITGDYSFIVDHNMQVIKSSPDVLYILVVRHDGLSLLHTADHWEQKERPDPMWEVNAKSESGSVIYSNIVKTHVYRYVVPLQFTGVDWGTLYIGLSLKHYEEQLYAMYRVIILLSMFCFIIAIVISYYFARRLTFPILSLQRVTHRIMEGDTAARAHIRSGDEVEQLAASFNKMTDKMVESQEEIITAYGELELYRKNLEEVVLKRTEQLTTANSQLQQELAERLRVEQALTNSEQRYRAIFETTGNANLLLGEGGVITMVNTAFEKLSGCERADVEDKKTWTEFFPDINLETMSKKHFANDGGPEAPSQNFEGIFVDSQGRNRSVYVTLGGIPGSSTRIVSILDVTDLKRLEAQLLQSQKMEAIGQLAGGVAHDFNNILTAIIGYASLLKMTVAQNDPACAYVDPILASAEKATNLTQGLLAFSRKQVIAPKLIDLNEAVRKVEHLLVRLMGEDIELKTSLMVEPVTVFADLGQIEQILINLATNARDAMPDGGLFSIKTDTVTLNEEDAKSGTVKKAGRYGCISVSDTGAGMSRETVNRIFEPFFTTKEIGKGTGLGLSIVYGIIKQHNGHINVYSEIGFGTTFTLYFPLVQPETKEEKKDEPVKPKGGTETILLAEDDDLTRDLTRTVLQKFGYTVIEAMDGEDAVARFKENIDRISLIILDVIMPKKNGKAVCEEVMQIKPDTKVLFVSGYTADIIHKKGIFEDNINFVSKPIIPDDLARKVRELLDH